MNSQKNHVYKDLNEITNPALAFIYIYFASDVTFSYSYTYLALFASRFKTSFSKNVFTVLFLAGMCSYQSEIFLAGTMCLFLQNITFQIGTMYLLNYV